MQLKQARFEVQNKLELNEIQNRKPRAEPMASRRLSNSTGNKSSKTLATDQANLEHV